MICPSLEGFLLLLLSCANLTCLIAHGNRQRKVILFALLMGIVLLGGARLIVALKGYFF